jgi:hypothetical protein
VFVCDETAGLGFSAKLAMIGNAEEEKMEEEAEEGVRTGEESN